MAARSSKDFNFGALAHPTRIAILRELQKTGEASPSELAGQLGEPLGNVSYHVRMLADARLIELVRTTPRRGALEHHYSIPGAAVERIDSAAQDLTTLAKSLKAKKGRTRKAA